MYYQKKDDFLSSAGLLLNTISKIECKTIFQKVEVYMLLSLYKRMNNNSTLYPVWGESQCQLVVIGILLQSTAGYNRVKQQRRGQYLNR